MPQQQRQLPQWGDSELGDESDDEREFEGENKYRDPSVVPLSNGRGTLERAKRKREKKGRKANKLERLGSSWV